MSETLTHHLIGRMSRTLTYHPLVCRADILGTMCRDTYTSSPCRDNEWDTHIILVCGADILRTTSGALTHLSL